MPRAKRLHRVGRAASRQGSLSPVRRFSGAVLAAIHDSRILGLRAGASHRFLGVWMVVVNGRVFVRSWNDTPTGWYRAFVRARRGAIRVGDRQIRVRATRRSGERLLDAIDLAYRQKYNTPGSRKYVVGFARPRRRLTTLELSPA